MTITYSFKITSINRLLLYIDENDNRYENLITWLETLISDAELSLMQSVINKNVTDITTKTSTLPWSI